MKNVKKIKFSKRLFSFLLFFMIFSDSKLFCESSDDDSDGGYEWSETEYSSDDGWDGTENTPNSPNDEPPVDGWGDNSEPYDGSYCYVFDDDGDLMSLYYDDVYDEKGNRIYHDEDSDVEERVYQHFYDEWLSQSGTDGASIARHYSDAVKALEAALLNGVEKEIAEAKAKLDEALSELIQYCEHFNYSWTANKSSVGIYNGNHKTVAYVGDPVIIALGKFVIDDADISVANGISSFSVERHYISNGSEVHGKTGNDNLERKNGAFGLLWNSNLDTRIIRGNNFFSGEIIEKIKNYASELSEAKAQIEDYASEDFECEPVLEELLTEISKNDENLAYFEKESEENEKADFFNRYTAYGTAGELNGSLDSGILIYCGDNGNLVLFEKSEETDSYFPICKAWKNKILIELLGDEPSDEENNKKFTVTFLNSGEKRYYSSFGLPVLFEKNDGSFVRFEYDENFYLSKISLDENHFLEFFWENGFLSSVSDGWRKIIYGYDDGNLVSVTDFDGDTRFFEYDSNGFLTKQVKADGNFISLKYEKCENERRISSVTDENGKSEYFEYDLQNRKTVYTDSDGVKTVYFYDGQKKTEKILYADERMENFIYDENENLVEWNNGFVFARYVRDKSGKIIEETDEFGAAETFSYDEERLILRKRKNGAVENYNYDDKNRITEVYLNGEKLKAFAYDKHGRLEKEFDCRENAFIYSYDSSGNLSEIRLQEKGKAPRILEHFEYDSKNRLEKHIGRDGIIKKITYKNHQIIADGSNSVRITKNYSSRKLIASEKIEDLLTNEEIEKKYEYDKTGKCVAVYVDGNVGNVSGVHGVKNAMKERKTKKRLLNEFEYTSSGKISRIVTWNIFGISEGGKSGTEILYDYDSAGNLCGITKRKLVNGDISSEKTTKITLESDGFTNKVTEKYGNAEKRFKYDFRDYLLAEEIGDSLITANEYGVSGKLLSRNFGAFEKLSYGYSGGFLSSIQEDGSVIDSACEVFYFPDGKMRKSVDFYGNVTLYEYNGLGMLIRASSPVRISEYEYDDCGKLLSKKVFNSGKRLIYEEIWVFRDFCRKVIHKIGGKLVDKVVKNGFGMLICKEDSVENLWTYSNDILGRKISETNPYGKTVFFEWNENNLLEKIIYPDGNFKKILYDLDFNFLEISDKAGVIQKSEYDDYGRLASFWLRPFSAPEKYEYDDYGRVLKVTRKGKTLLENFYDDLTRQINRKDSLGNISEWKFESVDRLLSTKNRNGAFSRNEWKNGNQEFSRDFNGLESLFSYGEGHLSSEVVFSNGEKISSVYNALGKLIFAENSNSSLSFEYDSAGNLIYQTDNISGEKIFLEYENGKLSKISGNGRKIFYSYGKCGEILKIQEISGVNSGQISSISFSYDSCGREILRKWNSGESLKIFYDEVGREILRAGFSSANELRFLEGFVYDENGFKTLVLDSNLSYTRYEYDEFGRIKSVSSPYSKALAERLESCIAKSNLFSLETSEKYSYESLSAVEYESLKKLCDFIGVKLSSGLKKYIKESFVYDLNSNLVKRITPFGEISYKYDKNDRLVAWGNGCSADYDQNGNLISISTPQKTLSLEYNAVNRVKKIIINDFESGNVVFKTCEYDALGRRTKSFVSGTGSFSSSYIGKTSREFLYVFSPYAQKDSASKMRVLENGGQPRIRYKFGFGNKAPENSELLENEISEMQSQIGFTASEIENADCFTVKSAPVFAPDGEIIWISLSQIESGNEKNLFMTSKNGTVRASMNDDGVFSSFEYDPFGFPLFYLNEKSVFAQRGFAGKKFDASAEIYDFGFRDYFPEFARFSSEDPVLDGRNWYSYCGGDFVNFVDRNGFELLYVEEQNMQSMDGENLGNSSVEQASSLGCVVTCIAEILSAYTGVHVDPSFINENKSNFSAGSGEVNWSGIFENYGLSHSKNGDFKSLFSEAFDFLASAGTQNSGNMSYQNFIEKISERDKMMESLAVFRNSDSIKASAIGNYINSIMCSSEKAAVVFQVAYDAKNPSSLHFVVANGEMFIKDGISYFPVSPTSINDRNVFAGSIRGMAGWIIHDGKVCVPASLVNRIDVIKKGS